MPNPVSSRDGLFNNVLREDAEGSSPSTVSDEPSLACQAHPEALLVCADPAELEQAAAMPPTPAGQSPKEGSSGRRTGADYMTFTVGIGAVISGSIFATVDRHGHVYVGVGGGVGLSATLGTVSITSGQLIDQPHVPDEATLGQFLEGDAINGTVGDLGCLGATNSAGGTGVEIGLASPQIGAQFEHAWRVR
jgi:hypothetical protein